VTKGALPGQRRQGRTSQARTALTKTLSGSAITQPRAPELKVRAFWSDERVKRSLYMRAVGYSYDSVKIFMPAGAKKPIYAPYVEDVPPDVTASIFWMKNRDPAEWRDA
jgi:hypothetical protein